jgi:hypothetical protein
MLCDGGSNGLSEAAEDCAEAENEISSMVPDTMATVPPLILAIGVLAFL